MVKSECRPIIVSGTPKSGSTWVGKMLSLSPKIGYIHEPFSPIRRPGVSDDIFKLWFTYVDYSNCGCFEYTLNDTFNFSSKISNLISKISSIDDGARVLAVLLRNLRYRLNQARPLIKDPIALFSLEWLAEKFSADVIVIIRHPAAFCNSLINARWQIRFDQLLSQRELISGPLLQYADEIQAQVRSPGSLLDQSILFWRIAHHQILNYKLAHASSWTFVRHEDLLVDPIAQFKCLYKSLSIPYNDDYAQYITKSLKLPNSHSSLTLSYRDRYINRSQDDLIKQWARELSFSDIKLVRDESESLWREFYSDSDW